MQLGNGLWETYSYNDRQQVTQIGLGVTDADTALLKLEYAYNTTGNTDNNGAMLEQKITVPTVGATSGFTATQTYAYDALNRLSVAEEKVSGSTTWKQTFTIDQYGNRRFDAANTTTLGSCTEAVCNPTISTATNRISTSGYTFDANGNLSQDAEGKQFLYDAENHQKQVKDANGNSLGQYFYDGEGRRVKKISDTETTVFVYDGGGQLVAEYSTALAQTAQVSYLTQDHLGSPRVITNENGTVTSRKDYSAFGEETISAERAVELGYPGLVGGGGELRKGYTGYEKDSESGLDYAQARYYNSTHGRYTSVDPLTASASIRNPQTFNRYSYVLNSPYKFSDPLGLLPASNNEPPSYGCSAELASCSDDEMWSTWYTGPTPDSNTAQANPPVAQETAEGHEDQQEAEVAEPPLDPGVPDDPQWLVDLRNAFPGFDRSDSIIVNTAITDAQNSVGPGSAYGTILIGQFRDSASATTPQQALDELSIGSINVTRDNQGNATNAEVAGNVFDGRTSTYPVDHDQNRNTPDITVAQYFKNNPTVNAITHGQYVFLGSGFFAQRPRCSCEIYNS